MLSLNISLNCSYNESKIMYNNSNYIYDYALQIYTVSYAEYRKVKLIFWRVLPCQKNHFSKKNIHE